MKRLSNWGLILAFAVQIYGSSVGAQESKMSEAEVTKYEQTIIANPNDEKARRKLLIHFGSKPQMDANSKKQLSDQVFWYIKNHPDFKDTDIDVNCMIHRNSDEAAYQAGKKLWLEQTVVKDYVAQVQANAAWYFQVNGENDLGEKYLLAAQKLEQKSQVRADNLGLFYNTFSHRKTGNECSMCLKKSLYWLEKAKQLGDTPYNLPALAFVACEAKQNEKAQKYAQLALDNGFSKNDAACVHYGNLVMGRLALRNKDLPMAKKYLLQSAKFHAGMKYWGDPNMSLAKELLENREKAPVLQYFELCGKFWPSGKDRLKTWSATVKQGKIPDFGASLHY